MGECERVPLNPFARPFASEDLKSSRRVIASHCVIRPECLPFREICNGARGEGGQVFTWWEECLRWGAGTHQEGIREEVCLCSA